jgi:hypothetical protein
MTLSAMDMKPRWQNALPIYSGDHISVHINDHSRFRSLSRPLGMLLPEEQETSLKDPGQSREQKLTITNFKCVILYTCAYPLRARPRQRARREAFPGWTVASHLSKRQLLSTRANLSLI